MLMGGDGCTYQHCAVWQFFGSSHGVLGDADAGEDACSGHAEQSKQEDRQEGMAECSHRGIPYPGNAAAAPPEVQHA